MSPPLPREFSREELEGDVLALAPRLLGCIVRHVTPEGTVAVRLSEVEAYSGAGDDAGSHSHRGRTPRNTVMFGPAGHLYVYFSYGMHWCVNLVCGPPGAASAVLLRAGEVVEGTDLAWRRRPACRRPVDLARGPARLASCLGLDGGANGVALVPGGPVHLVRPPVAVPAVLAVSTGPRVGLSQAADLPWRFWITDDRTVSSYRPAISRRRGGGTGDILAAASPRPPEGNPAP